MGGFGVGCAALALSLAVSAGLSGCAGHPSVSGLTTDAIKPIVLHVARNALVKIASSNPEVGGIILIGVVAYDTLNPILRKAKAHADGNLILVVNQTINGKAESSVFKVTTRRQLQVALDGHFVEEITPGEVIINAKPGTDSTITITDAAAGESVYRTGGMSMHGGVRFILSDHSLANLDTGKDDKVGHDHAELVISNDEKLVSTANGTVVAPWNAPGVPALGFCKSLPASEWTTALWKGTSFPAKGTTFCVHTSEGRYGAIVMNGGQTRFDFTYVIWKKPGDH